MKRTMNKVLTATGVEAIPVAGVVTVYSESFPLFDVEKAFGVKILAGGTGTKKVLVELEESNARPSTEGSADSDYVEADSVPDVALLTDTDLHIVEVEPILRMYGRLKLTGQSTNDASTTVTVSISR